MHGYTAALAVPSGIFFANIFRADDAIDVVMAALPFHIACGRLHFIAGIMGCFFGLFVPIVLPLLVISSVLVLLFWGILALVSFWFAVVSFLVLLIVMLVWLD